MASKNNSIKLDFVLSYKTQEFSYSIEQKNYDSTVNYYTTITVCKNGIAYHGLMNRKEKGFKTIEGAKVHLRTVLIQIGRNTSIEKDIAKLPIFCNEFQTRINFKK